MENKYLKNDNNMLSIEEVTKIKILKIYDFLNDEFGKQSIINANYSVSPILKRFNLSHYEVGAYLKNVCDLSQKLETGHVCAVLNSIKDKLEEDAKKGKKPSANDLLSKALINDERFPLFTVDVTNAEATVVEDSNKKIEKKEDFSDVTKLYSDSETDDAEEPEEPEEVEKQHFNKDEDEETSEVFEYKPIEDEKEVFNTEDVDVAKVQIHLDEFEKFKNSSLLDSDNSSLVNSDTDVQVVDNFDIQNNIIKELVVEDIDDEQEVPLVNIPKPKKKSGKFVFIASGALVVSILLAGTFMFVSSVLEDDGVVNNPNLITPSNNVLTPPPNSQLEELSKNNSPITMTPMEPSNNEETVSSTPSINTITPIVENDDFGGAYVSQAQESSLNPTISPEKDIAVNEERLEIIEKKLNTLLSALESNPNLSNGLNTAPKVAENTNNTKSSNIKDMVEGEKSQSTSFEFNNIAEIVKAMKNFKFNSNGFEYEGRLFKEGDTLGNIKIDTFVPNSYIEFREINTNGSRAVTIK